MARTLADEDAIDNPDWTSVATAPMDIGARLHFARVFLGMTQRDFATLLSIPASTLRNWEQRRTAPDAIARTLIELIYDDPEGMRDRLKRRPAA